MSSLTISDIYQRLWAHFGPQYWWPGDTALEIISGAVLTQNTAWRNVEQAIANLKAAELLPGAAHQATTTPPATGPDGPLALQTETSLSEDTCLARLAILPAAELAALIRPAGYYNIKAERLQNLLGRIHAEHDSLAAFLAQRSDTLRRQLLEIKGIGPETADSVLLYAARRPFFVVDTYTHRIFSRHGALPEEADYQLIQEIFHDALPAEIQLYNEYHALIVRLGKEYCRKSKPRCTTCPLGEFADQLE